MEATRFPLPCADWALAARIVESLRKRGALFVGTPSPPAFGTPVELVIGFPDGTQALLRGEVQVVVTPEQAAVVEGRRAGVDVKLEARSAPDVQRLERKVLTMVMTGATPPPVAPRAPTASMPTVRATATAMPVAGGPTAVPAQRRTLPPPSLWRRPPGAIAPAFGIDFGTSFSSISVAIGDRVYVIPDDEGRHLTPSVVSFDDGGTPLTGGAALGRLISHPRRTIASPKRLLGRSFSDPAIAGYLYGLPCQAVAGPNDSIAIDVDGEPVPLVRVCAAMLGAMRDLAERQLRVGVRHVVLSTPVSFSAAAKASLRQAARIAGLEVIDMVDEPAAGALAYGVGQGKDEVIAVYDFGGGTFDFTVMQIKGDAFRTLASEGDAWLGGDDFDLAIANVAADAFWRQTKVDVRKTVVEWQRLLRASEQAKRDLSTETETSVLVTRIIERPEPAHLDHPLDRAAFQRLAQELFDRSLDVVKLALSRAALRPDQIDQVITVGGVSNIPFVREGLGAYFGRTLSTLVSPEEAICAGAGLLAAKRARHPVVGVGPTS